jgi:hypothetical protein
MGNDELEVEKPAQAPNAEVQQPPVGAIKVPRSTLPNARQPTVPSEKTTEDDKRRDPGSN